MKFLNLWVDPEEVVAVFVDVEAKRTRIAINRKGAPQEICCDQKSGEVLLEFLYHTPQPQPKK